MPKITINGKPLEVPEGANVLEAAISNGIPLEYFCYQRYLPVAGNCRTCMVEVEGPRGPMLTIGCNTKVAEGMVVRTDSPNAKKAQKTALEFLLLDHPLDCPICDKAGECRLQDQYMQYGLYDFRRSVTRFFKGGKAEDIGEHVVLDQERCVLCTRCIRFLDEVPKSSELCIVNRGHEATLGIFPGKRLDNPYSGNVADVCPVGALTLKEFRFKQRVWFLKKAESVCPGCARGCNITVEHNKGRVYRFMPRENPGLNKTWICDEGRFSFDKYQQNRLAEVRVSGKPEGLKNAVSLLAETLSQIPPDGVLGLVSPSASLEDQYLLKKFFGKRFHPGNVAALSWAPKGEGDSILRLPEKHPNEAGLSLLGIPAVTGELLEKMEQGHFQAVILLEEDPFGHDEAKAKKAFSRVKNLVVLSTHLTKTAERAGWAFPSRSFLEKSGTFLNATARLQRFRAALEPQNPEVMEGSLWLGLLARALKVEGFDFADVPSVFNAMAGEVEALRGLSFSSIPSTGKVLEGMKPSAPEPFQNIKAQPNVAGKAVP